MQSASALIGSLFIATSALADMPADACITPAASFHKVNPDVLRAILVVESGLNPKAVNRNDNGTLDIGIGQMNSIHLRELSKYGISADDLKNPCIGTYVAAWHLARVIKRHGNTWFGIAAYHSTTPYFNSRYQALVHNSMVRAKVLPGPLIAVPPLRPGQSTMTAQSSPSRSQAQRKHRGERSAEDELLFALINQ